MKERTGMKVGMAVVGFPTAEQREVITNKIVQQVVERVRVQNMTNGLMYSRMYHRHART